MKISKLFNVFGKKSEPTELKNFSYSGLFDDLRSNNWHRVEYNAAMSLFSKNAVLHDAVMKIVKRFIGIKPIIKTKSGDIIEEHRVLDLLAHPNESQSYMDFATQIAIHYLVAGTAPIYIHGSNSRLFDRDYSVRPFDLYPVPPQYLTAQDYQNPVINVMSSTNKDMFMNGDYVYKSGRYLRKQSGEFFFKTIYTNPSVGAGVLSETCLSPILYELEQLNSGNDHNLSLLMNGVSLSGVFSVKNSNPEHLDQLKKDLRTYFSGTSGAGKYLVSSGQSIMFAPITATNKDMQYQELKEEARKVIYNYYEIPLAMVDNSASTMNNLQTSQVAIFDNAVLPMTSFLFDLLTELFRSRGALRDNEFISYEESSITALKSRRWEEINQKSQTKVFTTNELRADFGYEGVENGDVIYRQQQDVPIGYDLDTDDTIRKKPDIVSSDE